MGRYRQLIKGLGARCLPRRSLLVRGPSRPEAPAISLTFDDGPDPVHTPAVLAALAAADLKATFFVIGERAKAHPGIVRDIAAAGHELGNHTFTHAPPETVAPDQFRREVVDTNRLLEDLTGRPCRLMRPPLGRLDLSRLLTLWRLRLTPTLWSVDPKDYRMTSPAEMEAWCHAARLEAGDIVLLHDNHPYAAQAVRAGIERGWFTRFRAVPAGDWLR